MSLLVFNTTGRVHRPRVDFLGEYLRAVFFADRSILRVFGLFAIIRSLKMFDLSSPVFATVVGFLPFVAFFLYMFLFHLAKRRNRNNLAIPDFKLVNRISFIVMLVVAVLLLLAILNRLFLIRSGSGHVPPP